MFVTNWISTTKIQKTSEITNFFRHYFLSRTEVLIGASVMVQGTKTGAVTDLDGNFTIEAKNGQTLEVSYLALSPKRLKLQVRQST